MISKGAMDNIVHTAKILPTRQSNVDSKLIQRSICTLRTRCIGVANVVDFERDIGTWNTCTRGTLILRAKCTLTKRWIYHVYTTYILRRWLHVARIQLWHVAFTNCFNVANILGHHFQGCTLYIWMPPGKACSITWPIRGCLFFSLHNRLGDFFRWIYESD